MRDILRLLRYWVRRTFLRCRLALVSKETLDDYQSIMVVAPHPDDEILGLGGHLIRQVRSGKRITIVYLTDGEKSLEEIESDVVAAQRRHLTSDVLARLGVSPEQAIWLHLPDGAIPRRDSDGFGKAVLQLASIVTDAAPDALFVTHPLDTWPFDHIAAFDLAGEVIRKGRLHCDLYGYWVWLWYSMPLTNAFRIDWNAVCRLPFHDVRQEKKELSDLYLKPTAPDGRPWSGVLPKAMRNAFRYPYEVVERII